MKIEKNLSYQKPSMEVHQLESAPTLCYTSEEEDIEDDEEDEASGGGQTIIGAAGRRNLWGEGW